MPIRLSKTLKKLLFVYIGVFLVQFVMGNLGYNLAAFFALYPSGILSGKIWQILTYSFLHAEPMHLIFNLLILAFVGSDIESIWGTRKFLMYYFYCTTMAGLFYLVMLFLIGNPLNFSLPMIGASGGIYGLLLAYGILFPNREMLFMMLFPMKAKQFTWVLAGVEFLMAFSSGQSRLSSIAHLSGMGAGFLFLWMQAKGFQIKKSSTQVRKKNPGHLRLVKDDQDEEKKDPRTWH